METSYKLQPYRVILQSECILAERQDCSLYFSLSLLQLLTRYCYKSFATLSIHDWTPDQAPRMARLMAHRQVLDVLLSGKHCISLAGVPGHSRSPCWERPWLIRGKPLSQVSWEDLWVFKLISPAKPFWCGHKVIIMREGVCVQSAEGKGQWRTEMELAPQLWQSPWRFNNDLTCPVVGRCSVEWANSPFPEENYFWKPPDDAVRPPLWQSGLVSSHYNLMLQCRQEDVMMWHHPRRHFRPSVSAWQ